MVTGPFWFSTEHLDTALMPFHFSAKAVCARFPHTHGARSDLPNLTEIKIGQQNEGLLVVNKYLPCLFYFLQVSLLLSSIYMTSNFYLTNKFEENIIKIFLGFCLQKTNTRLILTLQRNLQMMLV